MSGFIAGRLRAGGVSPAVAWVARSARRAGERPLLVVGALFGLSAAIAAWFATQVTTFEPDALGYTHIAIALGDHPSLLTDQAGGGDRLNQLYPLTIAPLYRFFGNVTAFELSHWWNALLMGSTVIPVYLLARAVLARRGGAYAAAALAAVFPWLTLSSTQLTEVVAYPAAAWALFAMQRALVRPSWRADVLVILSVAVATYGRLQLGLLGPIFVVAVVAHELGWALTTGAAAAGGRAAALRAARRRLLADHVLLVAAAAVAGLAFVALVATGRLQQSFGFYGNTLSGQLFAPGMWRNAQANVTFLTWGVGVLPMVVTVGVVLYAVVAPRTREIHAFAWLTLLTLVGIIAVVGRINVLFNGAVVQERYVIFVVPLLAVGLLAGLTETRRPALATLLGAIAVVPLVATTEYEMIPSSFWFLVSPGLTWFFEAISPRLSDVAGALGQQGESRYVLAAWAIAGAGLLAAALLVALRRRRELVAATIVAAVLVLCATETIYSFQRVVDGSSDYRGFGSGAIAGSDWVDRAVGRDTPVALLASQLGQVSDSREAWTGAEFWNRSIRSALALSSPFTTWHPAPVVAVRRDGAIATSDRPRYVVVSTRGVPLSLAGREIAHSPDGGLALVDTAPGPLRATWSLRGLSDDGWLALPRPATLTVDAAPQGCREVRLRVAVPDGLPDSRTLRIRGGGVDRVVVVAPQRPRDVHVRLCGARRPRLTLSVLEPATATAMGATIQVRSVAVTAP